MKITMVIKIFPEGKTCRKCTEVKEYLNNMELMGNIDRIVEAVVEDPQSEGMRLTKKHNVERAPFFVVEEDDGSTEIYTSVLMLERDYF